MLLLIASHADVLWGSSHIPAPWTSAEMNGLIPFLLSLQISAGAHVQISERTNPHN